MKKYLIIKNAFWNVVRNWMRANKKSGTHFIIFINYFDGGGGFFSYREYSSFFLKLIFLYRSWSLSFFIKKLINKSSSCSTLNKGKPDQRLTRSFSKFPSRVFYKQTKNLRLRTLQRILDATGLAFSCLTDQQTGLAYQ